MGFRSASAARFQSTRPRGARRYERIWQDAQQAFQSTRPRGARLALAKELGAINACFNPRARVGRDCISRLRFDINPRFNPRARVGRDIQRGCFCRSLIVSIHAPAWGATESWPQVYWHRNRFNPRARVGRDKQIGLEPCLFVLFQSTRPRGARLKITKRKYKKSLFQSTRPRGARQIRS